MSSGREDNTLTKAEREQARALAERAASKRSQAASTDDDPQRVRDPMGDIGQGTGLCPECGEAEVPTVVLDDPRHGRRTIAPKCATCKEDEWLQQQAAQRAAERRAQAAEAQQRQHKVDEWLQRAGVDVAALAGASFTNYDPQHNAEALGIMQGVVEQHRAGAGMNVYLWSAVDAPGVGKSHLIVAGARDLLLNGDLRPGGLRYVRETRMVLTLRGMANGGRPEQYLDGLIGADLLLLDDIGKAKLDSAWLQELMYELFAAREGRPTWATSNFALEWLEEKWAWYAPLASRLAGGGKVVSLAGPDMRQQLPKTRRQ